MSLPKEEYVVGIDLGTTNSAICVSRDGGKSVESVKSSPVPHPCFINQLLPSVYCDTRPAGKFLIGKEAKQQMFDKRYRERVISNFKRKMRTPRVLLPLSENLPAGFPRITPPEVSSVILAY